MPANCCVFGCSNVQGKSGKRFYKIPADVRQAQAWITAINRKNWVPTEHSRVCSAHFISGKLTV